MDPEPFGRHQVAATSDLAQAREALESVFLPLELRPLDAGGQSGPLDMALNAVRVGEITVGYTRFGQGMRVQPAELENYHVDLTIAGRRDSRIDGTSQLQTGRGQGTVFLPRQEVETTWHRGCSQLTLMIPEHRVRSELEAILGRPVGGPVEFSAFVDLSSERGMAWVDALRLIERQSRVAGSLLDHPLAAANLERIVIEGLLLAQPHNYLDDLQAPEHRSTPRTVRKAIDLIQAHPERPWTIAELSREVAVSARSLQQGFQRSVGMPPLRYLRDVRLSRVRSDLQDAHQETTTVAQVAARWGFLHLGRFAASYRQKFGESPSRTLRG